MSTTGSSSEKKVLSGRKTPVPVADFIPGDLKIKLSNKFKGNKSKLDLFLV